MQTEDLAEQNMSEPDSKRIQGTTREQVRSEIPPHLQQSYDLLVDTYRFFALVHHGKQFVSYRVLAELVLSGWRPSA